MPEELPALQERYHRATGIEVDAERISYYRLAVDYRCAITTSLAVSRGGGARGWAPYLLVTQRYLDGIATRLSARLGVDETVALPPLTPTPRTVQFDTLVEGIRNAVRHIDDEEIREQTRNLQILVRSLRAHDQVGAEIEELDRADRAATLGSDALDDGRLGGTRRSGWRHRRRADLALPAPPSCPQPAALVVAARSVSPLTPLRSTVSAEPPRTP